MTSEVAFLLQVALILSMARLLGEIMRRLNQPPVLGELLAGILIGPSVLGWVWPDGFQAVFGDGSLLNTKQAALRHVSTVGLILLMLLTGLETDIRIMRNMGRAAFTASVFGMLIPFISGFLLGTFLDERFVLKERAPLALFLATAMAISAMPVIAKILLDLNMMKRNFGVVILSAAVVDDTVGWIILAVISGIVTTGSFELNQVLLTFLLLTVFIAAACYGLYPLLRWALPRGEQELRLPGGELVLVVVVAFLCAAATEAMHVHAVFGAFVAGVIFRQCPTLRPENLQRLETVVFSLFAPLFFGSVGLRVDLTRLSSFWLPVIVIAIAISGKVLGCYIGGIVGRMPPWEALALGLGMSARGAMELIVAKIGLDLGILNNELFSAIVLMALVTSMLAPITLRAIIHKLPLSEEEKLREKGAPAGFVPSDQLKVLIPVAGGNNAVIGCHLAAHLCRGEGDRATALYIESAGPSWWRGLFGAARERGGLDTEKYFARLRAAAGKFADRLAVRKLPAAVSVLDTIIQEAAKGYQFMVVGAARNQHPLYDPFISEMVKGCPCHLIVVSRIGGQGEAQPFRRILVPTNGSYFSDAAVELAARYAESSSAAVTVLYIAETRKLNPLLPAAAITDVSDFAGDMLRVTLQQQFSERFKDPSRLECHVRESQSVVSGLVEEVQRGDYDLVIFGAENKSLVERLYLGQHLEAALTEVPSTIALVIPKVSPVKKV